MLADPFQAVEKAGLLDTQYLDSLEAHLGQATTLDILADGMIELTDKLRRARELAAADSRAGLARLAHDIAGTAGQLGLHALTLAARSLEKSLLRDRCAACDRLASDVHQIGPRSIAALRTRISGHG
ncbi:MAG: Hpt domain-containing protein [Pseudomonadota bacterium]